MTYPGQTEARSMNRRLTEECLRLSEPLFRASRAHVALTGVPLEVTGHRIVKETKEAITVEFTMEPLSMERHMGSDEDGE